MSCRRPSCTRAAYVTLRGLCRFHYEAQQRQLMQNGSLLGLGRVDAKPVAEHIKQLHDSGMDWQSISNQSGVTTVTLWRIPKQNTVSANTAARIMRVNSDMFASNLLKERH